MQKIIYLVFVFISVNSFSQQHSSGIETDLNKYIIATKKHDFKNIVAYTYPKLVSLVNKDTLLSKVSARMVKMQEEGLRYKSITTNVKQKVYKKESDFYCFVPLNIKKHNSQGEIIIDTYLFAISNNKGKHWYFLTEEQFVKNKTRLFPLFDSKIELPKTSSKFIRNKNFSSFKKPK